MKKIIYTILFYFLSPGLANCQQLFSSMKSIIAKDTASNAEDTTDFAYISGTGGTDALNFDKLTASGGLNMFVYLAKKIGWNGHIAFNFSGEIKTDDGDSIPLSTVYFPDIGTSSFLAGTELSLRRILQEILKNHLAKKPKQTEKLKILTDNINANKLTSWDFILLGEISFQKRNILKDTVNYHFNITNQDVGLGLRWFHTDNKRKHSVTGTFAVFPLNQIMITNNDEKTFNSVFAEERKKGNLPTTISGISVLAAIEFNETMIYFRTFRDYESLGDYYYSIGLKATGKFFSF